MNTADFKTARRLTALNRFLQVVLALALAISLNYLASSTGTSGRVEILPTQSRTLALETRKQIEAIARRAPAGTTRETPWVTIYLTLATTGFTDPADIEKVNNTLKQLTPLLDDIHAAAATAGRDGWLRIEQTDNLRRAGIFASLRERYPGIDAGTVLVVTCKDREKDRCKIIGFRDLATTRPGTSEPLFTGEEALTSALLGVTGEKAPVVYHITGHGEMSPADRGPNGFSQLDARLRARNILLHPLDLAKVNEVPTDADLLFLPAPRVPIPPAETEKLRRYMRERNGRLIALVNPAVPIGSLDDLFYDWGIIAQDARVHDTSPDASDAQGNLLVRLGAANHELTRHATGRRLAFAKARPVSSLGDRVPDDETRTITPLAATFNPPDGSRRTWGERNYNTPQPWVFDAADIDAPITVATVAERAIGIRMNLGAAGGRLLVVGSGDIATNARLGSFENAAFLLDGFNWMLDRAQFIGIPPRTMKNFQLGATNADLARVARWFALLPLAALLFGLLVFLWRRTT
jgi:hypothetical protein